MLHHISQTRLHLDYLHQQILSIITATQLRRIFEKRNNFDLRRLLDGMSHLWDIVLYIDAATRSGAQERRVSSVP